MLQSAAQAFGRTCLVLPPTSTPVPAHVPTDKSSAPPANITIVRRDNAVSLFQQFVEAQVAAGKPPKGLEQAFAQQLEISASLWSQIKTAKPIGDKLARQIESHCKVPEGWLDQERELAGPSAVDRQIAAMALKAAGKLNNDGKRRLKALLKKVIDEGQGALG